jgi:protoporphyrinogen oxidase
MDLIIGAGISGLSYAKFTNNDYLIIEKEAEAGGYCRTIKRNGFVWDYSGHFFHFQDPIIKDIVCAHIDQSTMRNVIKKTQIYYNGQYVDFPFQKNIHQLDKQEFIDCLYDLYVANKQSLPSRTFKEMVYNKLGKSIAEKFLVPYNEKLYACDLNHLEVDAMGRFFPKATLDDILENFKHKDSSSYNSYFTYPTGGAEQYVLSMVKYLDEAKISLEEEVQSIDLEQKLVTTNKRQIHYDNLISTLPFPVLLDLAHVDYQKKVFTCNKVLVFNIGFDRQSIDRENSWVYFPSKDLVFYRIGYYNNIIGSDKMSIYVEIGFPDDEDLTGKIEVYFDRTIEDLRKIGVITEHKVVDYEAVVMNPAYVHINEASNMEIESKKQFLSKYNVYSIGRYGSWTYCSIEDNIKEAKSLAENIRC